MCLPDKTDTVVCEQCGFTGYWELMAIGNEILPDVLEKLGLTTATTLCIECFDAKADAYKRTGVS